MCYYEAKQTINDIFYLQKGKKMKQNRVEAVLKNMESLNLSQILITDPLAIFYLTGRMIKPFERFYALYLNQNGNQRYLKILVWKKYVLLTLIPIWIL